MTTSKTIKIIYYKIPFLSVLINTISLSCFVLRAWDPSLNIEKIIPFSSIFGTLFVIAAEIYNIVSLAVLPVS